MKYHSDLPPGPYDYMTTNLGDCPGNGHVYIIDANGRKIASIWGNAKEKIAFAEAICECICNPVGSAEKTLADE